MLRRATDPRHARVAIAIAGAVTATWLLGAPATAGAATQIGETFIPDTSDSNETLLQSGSPGGQYAVPFSGVITSWSFQAGPNPPTLNFKVARSAGGNDFTIVGESGLETGILANVLHTFPTRIPVQAGDVIGFFIGDSGEVRRIGVTGYTVHDDDDDLDQPVGRTDLYAPAEGDQLDLSAMLEPDCDSDGLGDETQDQDVPLGGACPKGNRNVTLDASKNRVKKGKQVTFSGAIAETRQSGACTASQAVELQRKKPSQSTFTAVEELSTDASGAFAAKRKVKKTFEYRAQVPETATCAGQTSNTEKVKVKKPK